MRNTLALVGPVAGVLALATFQAPAAGLETWDDPGEQNHGWSYWGTPAPAKDYPTAWSATGGVGNSGHISTSLPALVQTQNAYWPAYWVNGPTPDPADQIDLTLDPWVRISLWTDPGTSLEGGAIRFFIGEWVSAGNQVFYASTQPLAAGSSGWVGNEVWVGNPDPSAWIEVFRVGSTRQAADLFTAPQQYGFGLVGVTQPASLAGTLRLDNFEVIPEAPAAGVAALGLLGLAVGWRNRRS
jgi:hypothetical protein